MEQLVELTKEKHEMVLEVKEDVVTAHQDAQKGLEHLNQAVENSNKGFQNRCCCLLAILGLCGLVLVPVLMSILSARGIL